MRDLARYLKNHRKESILGPLFKLTEALFELFVPLVVAAIIDRGIGKGDTAFVTEMGLLMVGLGAAGLVCSLTAQYYAAHAAVGAACAIREDLFHKIQSLEYPQLDRLGASAMITRMTSDVQQVQSGINLTLRLFLRSPFVVFGAMIMAFTVEAKVAWIFCITIALLAAVVFGIMLLTMPLHKKAQAALDQVTRSTRENLLGARVVRAFAREEQQTHAFNRKNELLAESQRLAGRLSALTNPVTYVIVNLALVALIRAGAVRVDGGFITQGAVVALVNYMSQILVELVKLANLIVTMTRSLACWNRVRDVLNMDVPARSGSISRCAQDAPAVAFEGVSLTYPGAGAPSLTDIDFTVMPGMTVGVIGGTGSGKTSLINLIPGFYQVVRGRVTVLGRDVKEWEPHKLREHIGMVPQKVSLISGTVRDNMKWGKQDASDDEIMQALKTAQALDFVKEKGGLDFVLEPDGRNLSGGQRQRLTIARALVRKPEILILDDSASALDFATDAALRAAIRSMPGLRTTFIVSQRAFSVQHADFILVLDDGRLAGRGTHEQLMASCAAYREIYLSQFPEEAKEHV